MKFKALILACLFFANSALAQVINMTPAANTIIISTNTTVGIGAGNFKTYLVCPGATLTYAESSTMDTILLESGATVKFDSAFSYGYALVYAKAGSTVDMNFRQTGKLTYVNGVSVLDTNAGPSSFFLGANLVTSINYNYANLPGGTGCAPNALDELKESSNQLISAFNNGHELTLQNLPADQKADIKIINMTGQICLMRKLSNATAKIDISSLPQGIYKVIWNSGNHHGTAGFSK